MVRIIIILFLSTQFCYSQISNSQFYFGRGLDSAAILTNDIADSSIIFRKLMYVNGPKLIGNPDATYDSLKCIKLGTNLSFSNDTLNASGASGNVNQNGNSFGATMVLGSNDNNTLELETNGVSRLGITSGATTGGELTSTIITTNTSTLTNAFTIRTNSTGTASTGFGGGILFQGESSTTDNRDMVRITPSWNTATDASRRSELNIALVNSAGSLTNQFNFNPVTGLTISTSSGTSGTKFEYNGITTSSSSFVVGNSNQALTIGGSSGTVTLTTSSTSTGAIIIAPTANAASATAEIQIGAATNLTQTSGTRNYMHFNNGFAPTSGTAINNQVTFDGTYNQTGGANGITRLLNLNPTLTAVANFRGIDIAYSNSNAYGIYQSGSATKNIFVGKTCFGSTGSPTALVALAAGTTSANTAPLKFTSGSNLTTPEDGAVEYDGTNFFVSNSTATRYTVAKILSGHATLNFGNTAAGSSDDLTVTVTGAADGDEVILGVPNAAMNANASYFAWVSAADTLTIRHNNYSGSAIDPTSSDFKFSVIKR